MAAPRARAAQPAGAQRHGARVPRHRLGARQELLDEAGHAGERAPVVVLMNGKSLRDLARNGMAHEFHPADSERGTALLDEAEHSGQRAPVVILLNGKSLVDPTNAELAAAYGVNTELADPDELFDVIVVGAGPAGLGVVGLRLVRGPQGAHHRARVDRRAGRRELADPQLPRLRARGRRRRPGPARLPAGLGLRLALPAHVRGRVAPHGARPARARDRGRRGGVRAHRGGSPPAPPTAGSASRRSRSWWARASTTGLRVRRHRRRRAGTRSCSAAATRPARPRCTCRATPSR